jgi:ribosome recycling factor
MNGQSEIKVFTYPNAIVRVHFPDLTDEEQKKRMKRIHKAASELLKEKRKNHEMVGKDN